MINLLEKLGLSEKEAKVYLASLELGAETVQNIARKAQVNRATTYVILESLAKKGLATTFDKGKKTFFTAESPEQLDLLLRKVEEDAALKRAELEKSLPELKAIFNLAGNKPKIKFYEGKTGIMSMQDDFFRNAKENTDIYIFSALDNITETFPSIEKKQASDRVSRKINANIIYTNASGPIEDSTNKKEMRIARYIPKDKFPFSSSISIIPNQKIKITKYDNNFIGIMINNKEIANTFKAIFDLAWEAAEKYNQKQNIKNDGKIKIKI